MKQDSEFHPVNNNLSWVHPEDIKDYERNLRNFVYTKKGKVKKRLPKSFDKEEAEMFIKCQVNKFRSAHRLDDYMSFRSFREFPPDGKDKNGDGYSLDAKFYYDSFARNCFEFFGIKCCPCCGEIIEDTQNPEAYERFCKYEIQIKSEQRTLH